MFGGDDDEPDQQDDRRDRIKDMLDEYEVQDYSTEVSGQGTTEHVESRDYRGYKESAAEQRKKHWYERLVSRLGIFSVELSDLEEDLNDAIRLLDWDVRTDRIFAAGLMLAGFSLVALLPALLLNIPSVFKLFALIIPVIILFYFTYYPVIKAQKKVIGSSDELIMAILYMVVYMRNSPNMEGAVRFAALNTTGAIASDLKNVLWEAEVGNYPTVQQAFETYAERWQPYNRDFIQSIELLQEAMSEPDNERRDTILSEALDHLLQGTRQKMKRYSRELKMPVSATFGMGVLLPVLGIILFPLVGSFMGGENLSIYLAFTYNIVIPGILYAVMYHTLIKRPPTVSTQAVESDLLPEAGKYTVEIGGHAIKIPAWIFAIIVFVVVGAWPISYYLRVMSGEAVLPPDAATQTDATALTMFRSLLMTLAISFSIGTYYYVGNKDRVEYLQEVEKIEDAFPEALFQLGNSLSRGNPIELGIRQAVTRMQDVEIKDMFNVIAYNMSEIGMTFEEAIFDDQYGAIRQYPSQTIQSVMRAITQSSQKGTRVVARAMMSISDYLKNIYKTEEEIQERLGETMATMVFVAFVLAPIISGVALGLGTIITKAFYMIQLEMEKTQLQDQLGNNATNSTGDLPDSGQVDAPVDDPGEIWLFTADGTVPPDILQLVIGIYLIELMMILGIFYTRLTEGRNPVIRKFFTGKAMLITPTIYAVATLILVGVFGTMIASALATG